MSFRRLLRKFACLRQVGIYATRRRWAGALWRRVEDRPAGGGGAGERSLGGSPSRLGVALGGFGARPLLLSSADEDPGSEDAPERIGRLASEASARAGDAWASPEYRSEIAGILVRRVILEAAAP